MEEECEKRNDGTNAILLECGWCSIIWIVVNVLLTVLIVSGNLLTILAVRTCRRLRAYVSNMFILSLAVSDFIVGLTLPYHLAFYMGSNLGKSHIFCLLRFNLIIFACSNSLWNLILIAIDRYIAIIYPLHYPRYITRRVAMITIALGWIVGSLIAGVPVFWNHWKTANACEFDEILPKWYVIGVVTPGFAVVWIVMLLVYWRIVKEASKQVKQMRKASCSQAKPFSSDWKSVQVVLLIMGCFTLCWLPYFVIFAFYRTSHSVYKGVLVLAMANSGLNPLIYAWKHTSFRKSFALLLRCRSPNAADNSEYSVREPCARNGCKPQDSAPSNCIPVATISPLTSVTQSNLQPVSNQLINREPVSTTNELNAIQLLYRSEVMKNQMTKYPTTTNEPYAPTGVLCSSCMFCKLMLQSKTELGSHLKGSVVQWGCAEYNKYVLKTIKCRW